MKTFQSDPGIAVLHECFGVDRFQRDGGGDVERVRRERKPRIQRAVRDRRPAANRKDGPAGRTQTTRRARSPHRLPARNVAFGSSATAGTGSLESAARLMRSTQSSIMSATLRRQTGSNPSLKRSAF